MHTFSSNKSYVLHLAHKVVTPCECTLPARAWRHLCSEPLVLVLPGVNDLVTPALTPLF